MRGLAEAGEYARDFEARLRAYSAQVLLRNALAVEAAHKKNLSLANPPPHRTPAMKGQFPKLRTSFLRSQVALSTMSLDDIARRGEVTVGVRSPAFYGEALRKRGWLGLIDTYEQMRGSLIPQPNRS